MIEKNVLCEKIKFYSEKDIVIHVQTPSGTFYNGKIIGIDTKSIILDDLKLGETYISFEEILDVQPFKEKN